MGRPKVAPKDRRVKCHTGNVMIPNWVYDAIIKKAIKAKKAIKDVLEDALTEFARRK